MMMPVMRPAKRSSLLLIAYVIGLSAVFAHAASAQQLAEADDAETAVMVRGAMGDATLIKDQWTAFRLATDGPGVLTVCWTEPNQNLHARLVGPKDKTLRLVEDGKLRGTSPILRYATLHLHQPGAYTLELLASRQTHIHLGYTWIPFEQVQDSPQHTDNETVKTTRVSLAKTTNDRQRPMPVERDKEHWLEGEKQVPFGYVRIGSSPSSIATRYHMPAGGPGLLTLAVRGIDQADMAIAYRSHAHRPTIKGHVDDDLHGNPGAEQATILLTAPDNLLVEIDPLAGGGSYAFSGAWLSLHGVIQPLQADDQP